MIDSTANSALPTPPRRDFFKETLAVAVGTLAGAVPACVGAICACDPLLRGAKAKTGKAEGKRDAEGFLQITSLDALSSDGAPRAFKVIDDLQDAWNKFPNTELGAVFLSRAADGEVTCFNARCPHLGCRVNFEADEQQYLCPCHASSFGLSGKPNNNIPPRNLDQLETRIKDGQVWVKFQNFRAGTEEQKPV